MKLFSRARDLGVSQRKLNYVMLGVVMLLSAVLLVTTFFTISGYKELRDASDDYMALQKSAYGMQQGSDYLTEQVRSFAVTGSRAYLDNYFREVNTTRRRDEALNAIKGRLDGSEAAEALNDAMMESIRLMDRECYSMRLVIASRGYNISAFPDAIKAVALTAADAALSPGEQADKARLLVFDDAYEGQKQTISENMQRCLDYLENTTLSREKEAADDLSASLTRQQIMIFVLIILTLVMVVMTSVFVILPLIRAVPRIRDDEPLDVNGSYEYHFLAKTYNRMYSINKQNKERLEYEATHDELTGAYNRAGYEAVCRVACCDDYALILLDIDEFKQINDRLGHDVGDKVLIRVAEELRQQFRSGDYICRIGGDEFVVIMTKVGPAHSDMIRRKIDAVNGKLLGADDASLVASISVGVAFGNEKNGVKSVFKRADNALYEVKNNGRSGCKFVE